MSNNIDDLFKKALGEQKCNPPTHVWEGIEKHLNKRRRLIGLWWWRGVAAGTLIAALLGIRELQQYKQYKTVADFTFIDNKDFLQKSFVENTEVEIEKNTVNSIEIKTTEITKATTSSAFRVVSTPINILKLKEKQLFTTHNPIPVLKNGIMIRNFIPLTSKEALRNNKEYLALLAQEPQQEKIKEQIKLELSGHFVPAYSSGSYSSSMKNTRGQNYSDKQINGLMNTGGGLKIAVSKGKRLSLQTGIFYSRMGQKTTADYNRPATMALGNGKTEPGIVTPLGNIKPRRKAVAYRSAEAIVLNSIASTDETLEQVFGALEVPVQLRYHLNDNKVLFSITGGLCGNFIVNNKVYLRSGSNKELLGSTEDIRNFNLSTDWGVGIEYPVTPKVKVMLEPGLKYYLQSLSRNAKIDFKPYMFSLSTGIGICF